MSNNTFSFNFQPEDIPTYCPVCGLEIPNWMGMIRHIQNNHESSNILVADRKGNWDLRLPNTEAEKQGQQKLLPSHYDITMEEILSGKLTAGLPSNYIIDYSEYDKISAQTMEIFDSMLDRYCNNEQIVTKKEKKNTAKKAGRK